MTIILIKTHVKNQAMQLKAQAKCGCPGEIMSRINIILIFSPDLQKVVMHGDLRGVIYEELLKIIIYGDQNVSLESHGKSCVLSHPGYSSRVPASILIMLY